MLGSTKKLDAGRRNHFKKSAGGGEKRKQKKKGPPRAGMMGVCPPTLFPALDPAVVSGVRVHDFAIETGLRNAETVAFADDRRGVDDGNDEVFSVFAAADEGKNTVVGVVGVNPFETVPVKLDLMEGGFGGIEMIEIADEALDAAMGIVLKEMPVKTAGFAPFATLGEFLAHKEKFLARVGALIGVEQSEIGELLPHVAGHFVKKRIFAVDDFVVGEGKQEIFRESIKERESEFVVFVLAMNRVVGKVF